MSASPPISPSRNRLPGAVILLGFASAVLVLLIAVFGYLAFRSNDAAPANGPDPATALEVRSVSEIGRSSSGEKTTVRLEIVLGNTAGADIPTAQVYAQCSDGNGVVSLVYDLTSPVKAGEEKTVVLELQGNGSPSCASPVVKTARI